MSDLILYTSDDGQTRLDLRVDGGTAWLTQLEIADLFQTSKNNISIHTKNIFETGELMPEATVKESLTVQNEGNREVKRNITHYNLDLILAIGYRVRSPRGTQFRQWATSHLREYLVKGFVMDDQRLKNPGDWDYFDGPGSISHEAMKKVVHERYETFDGNRKTAEAIAADAEDLKALEQLEDELKRKKSE